MNGKLTEFFGKIKKLSVKIWNCLFPKECLGCGKDDTYCCESCVSKMKLSAPNVCFLCNEKCVGQGICGKCVELSVLDAMIVSTNYKNTLAEKLIKHLKYDFVVELVVPLVGLLKQKIEKMEANELFDRAILIPVPLHRRRFLSRGFNQAEIIAKELAAAHYCELKIDIVKMTKSTKKQFGLSREERQKNVAGVFIVVKPELVVGKKIIVIDDVLTTGATLAELARALKKCGATKIIGAAIAHE
ncbi:ComF family protein [Candidatus Falkowbacteria bacterium]|nr:ComF family protein [Candidatus Falkowbacteria bacterium]